MPIYERPGRAKYVAATKAVDHGKPTVEGNFAGTAVKQKPQPWSVGLTGQQTIAITERFVIRDKGICEVANTGIAAAVVGDPVYIVAATNALTTTAAGNVKFGRVAELPGAQNRGVATGKVRIDLDQRDF